MINNVIYIEFLNKKNYPKGIWMSEPDICQWESYSLSCLAIRDMKLGIWRGFVALTKEHKMFNKPLIEFTVEKCGDLEVYGGLSIVGQLPPKFKALNRDRWWVGFECTQGEDLIPLVKFDLNDPVYATIRSNQTYKDLHFVRTEIKYFAKQLSVIK